MADKILRSITDVEVVEQMTENDTVLIEQNGEIKRTKGVVGGGGEKYIIDMTPNAEGTLVLSWATPISYEEFVSKFSAGEDIRVILRVRFGAIGVMSASETSILANPNESMDAIVSVDFVPAPQNMPPIRFFPDETIQIAQG